MSSFRRLIASMLALLIIAAILPFVLPLGKDGKPLMELPSFSAPKLPDIDPGQWLPSEQGDSEVTVYRWRDAEGNWHYGERPPEGVAYEERTLDTDTNLIQALPGSKPEPTPGAIANPLDRARGVEQNLQESHEQRMRQLDGQ